MKIILTRKGFAVEGLDVTPSSADTPFALRLIALLSDAVDDQGLARPEIYLGVTGVNPSVSVNVVEKGNAL